MLANYPKCTVLKLSCASENVHLPFYSHSRWHCQCSFKNIISAKTLAGFSILGYSKLNCKLPKIPWQPSPGKENSWEGKGMNDLVRWESCFQGQGKKMGGGSSRGESKGGSYSLPQHSSFFVNRVLNGWMKSQLHRNFPDEHSRRNNVIGDTLKSSTGLGCNQR